MADAIFYRTFKNMDGPALCRVWNRSRYVNILGEMVDEHAFDQFVASKLIFEPEHLVVAVEPLETPDPTGLSDGRIVGYVHGGFGPNQEMNGSNQSVGYIAMLVVEEREDARQIRARLLFEMEKIFFRMGIRTVVIGAVYPNAPFYTGRLFGCEPNGILENDPFLPQILFESNYAVKEKYRTLTFILNESIPLTFAQEMRSLSVELVNLDENLFPGSSSKSRKVLYAPIIENWWDVCAHVSTETSRFELRDRETLEPVGWVGARVMARNGQMKHILGLHHLYIKPEFRNQGYAKLLLTLVLNQIQRVYHSCLVDLLVPVVNTSALQTFAGLNFVVTATGNVYERILPEDFEYKEEKE